jgi:hypothetical protein
MLEFFYIFHLQRSAHNNRGDTRRSGASLGSGGGGVEEREGVRLGSVHGIKSCSQSHESQTIEVPFPIHLRELI